MISSKLVVAFRKLIKANNINLIYETEMDNMSRQNQSIALMLSSYKTRIRENCLAYKYTDAQPCLPSPGWLFPIYFAKIKSVFLGDTVSDI